MDLTSVKEIKILLEKHNAWPIKSLGQNFLISRSVLQKMVSCVGSNDTIIEVGSGLGTLTKELAERAKRVVAVEKDKKMISILKETLKGFQNVKVIEKDILKIPDSRLPSNYKVVANLPYYISTAVIRKFLESENPPKEMILTVQKEVAQRICAKPPNMSILATAVQFYAKPEILFSFSRSCFWPMPNVDSSVLKITPLAKKLIDADIFFKIVKAGFSRPRAQLLNNFSKELKLDKETVRDWLAGNNTQSSQRAETLNVKDWTKLAKSFSKIK